MIKYSFIITRFDLTDRFSSILQNKLKTAVCCYTTRDFVMDDAMCHFEFKAVKRKGMKPERFTYTGSIEKLEMANGNLTITLSIVPVHNGRPVIRKPMYYINLNGINKPFGVESKSNGYANAVINGNEFTVGRFLNKEISSHDNFKYIVNGSQINVYEKDESGFWNCVGIIPDRKFIRRMEREYKKEEKIKEAELIPASVLEFNLKLFNQ